MWRIQDPRPGIRKKSSWIQIQRIKTGSWIRIRNTDTLLTQHIIEEQLLRNFAKNIVTKFRNISKMSRNILEFCNTFVFHEIKTFISTLG
jgi:hypothetical protein